VVKAVAGLAEDDEVRWELGPHPVIGVVVNLELV
jgi:hypothetical protein